VFYLFVGCEFFKEWKDNSYFGEMMKFDWNQVCITISQNSETLKSEYMIESESLHSGEY
jgi:hypothetical protein